MERNIDKAIAEIKSACAETSTEQGDLIIYSLDATRIKHKPDIVVFPQSVQEVSAVIKICARHKIPVTPRGAGTGFAGGSVPIEGGVVMAMTKMNRLLMLNKEALYVEVEPGIVNAELNKELAKEGLFYPPDPASLKSSTIGGNVGTGAGGPSAVKYGVTSDYVMGLSVVLANGEILETGIKTEKGVVGYDLKRLFTGSEGTLGVIVKIRLKVVPKPETIITATAVFNKRKEAVDAVTSILGRGLKPRTLEYIDQTAILCVEGYLKAGLPTEAAAMLLIETDGDADAAMEEMEAIKKICLSGNAESFRKADTVEEYEAMWKTRRSISPSLQRLRPVKINEDITVPRNRMAELMERLNELSEKSGLPIINFGHAGDGNIHVNVMAEKDEYQKALETVDEVFNITLELDGTLSGEHGVGLAKKPYIAKEIGKSAIEVSKALKKAFDPNNILNPGKLFP